MADLLSAGILVTQAALRQPGFRNSLKAVNEEGWKNIDRAGRTTGKAAKFGYGIFKLFRR